MKRLLAILVCLFSTSLYGGFTHPVSDAIYVWRYPPANGTPVDYAEAERLVAFCKSRDIGTIYYDVWGFGENVAPPYDQETVGRQSIATLAPIIALFHANGLRVEALYTDGLHFADVLKHNRSVPPASRFDAIRMDLEAGSFPIGTWPGGGYEPTAPIDLDLNLLVFQFLKP